MKKRIAPALCLLLLAGIGTVLSGQSQPRTGAAISVTLVEVPVNVYDRAGNAVRGLTAADFEITDEGKRQTISNFEEIDLAKVAELKQTPSPAARRNFMLLFDLTNSTPGTIGRSRQAALDFVKNELTPADVVAVATYSVENGFKLLTAFTTDRDALAAAVTTLGNPKFFKNMDPLLLAAKATGDMSLAGPMTEGAGGGGKLDTERASGASERSAEMENVANVANQQSQRADMEYRRGRVNQQITAFANIGRLLDSVTGRKQIILLSEGFDANLIQGRDAAGSASANTKTETDKIMAGEAPTDMDTVYGNTTSSNAVSNLGQILKRSDVVLHAIDIKGLRSEGDVGGGSKRGSTEGLYLMTRPTGGEVFKNANDLSTSFHALMKQQEVVYILGFQPAAGTKPGKFHNLKVKVKTPGAKVSYRAGYYEPNPTPSALEAALSAGEILLNDVAFDAVRTNVIASPFPVKGQNPQVPVIVEINGQSLMPGAKNQSVNGELFVYAFDRDNKVADFLYQKFGLDLSKVCEALQKTGLKYYGTLSLPPGEYSIKTLVRVPEGSLDGFKRVDIVVPDFSKPTVLQPIATEQPGLWLMVRGSKPGPAPQYPFAVAAESFIPAGVLNVSAAAPQRLALFTYQIDPNDLTFSGTLKAADGNSRDAKLEVVKKTPQDAAKAAQTLLALKTDGLTPGRYALSLNVQAKTGGWSKAFTIPVTVQ